LNYTGAGSSRAFFFSACFSLCSSVSSVVMI
jgi:hypothetical protein